MFAVGWTAVFAVPEIFLAILFTEWTMRMTNGSTMNTRTGSIQRETMISDKFDMAYLHQKRVWISSNLTGIIFLWRLALFFYKGMKASGKMFLETLMTNTGMCPCFRNRSVLTRMPPNDRHHFPPVNIPKIAIRIVYKPSIQRASYIFLTFSKSGRKTAKDIPSS